MRTASLAFALLCLFPLGARALTADDLQARLTEALDDMVNGAQLAEKGDTDQAGERWTHAAQLYAAIVADLDKVELPPASRDDVKRLALYNGACAHARLGHEDQALDLLGRALDAGYEEFEHIEADPDLAELREAPRFAQLLERARARLAQAAQAEAQKQLSAKALFDYELDVTTLDGKHLSARDLRGKVVIVDFWGTWCPPCREEIPHFVELAKRYGDRLVIVGMTFERGQPRQQAEPGVRQFAEQLGVTYPLVWAERADLMKVPQLTGFPTTLFLDKQGRVRAREEGYRDLQTLDHLVQALLAEPDPGPESQPGSLGPF